MQVPDKTQHLKKQEIFGNQMFSKNINGDLSIHSLTFSQQKYKYVIS